MTSEMQRKPRRDHTPGPWSIIPTQEYDGDEEEFEGAYTSPASIEGADGNPVCVFGTCEGSGSLYENSADYSLIAAAPELLSIAKRWAALDGGSWHVDRHAREKAELLADTKALISLAEGGSNGRD